MYVSMYHVHVISDDNRVQCIFGKSDHYVDETLIYALQCNGRLQLLRRFVLEVVPDVYVSCACHFR